MEKTIGKRLLSAVTATFLAATYLIPNGVFADEPTVAAAEVPDSEKVTVLVPSDDRDKVQTTDKSTLLVGDGIMLETEPAMFKGNTLNETKANYNKHYALGIASQFSIFLSEDFTPMQSDAEGRVAVGGNINVEVPGGWGGYAIGKGDYVTNETLDQALGKVESPGYAHIIMGGQITKNNILSESYSGSNTRKLVINVDMDDPDDDYRNHLSFLPNAVTPGVIDQSQTYVAKLLDFDTEFSNLAEKSAEWAAKGSLDWKKTETTDDNLYEYNAQTKTFTFYYNGKKAAQERDNEADEVEYVYFTVDKDDWDDYAAAQYVEFVNIPRLPEDLYGPNGRKLMDVENGSLTEEYWDRSFIVVSCTGTNISVSNDDNGAKGQKFTKINDEFISRSNASDSDASWNNHKGTSGILYNFPNATKVILGNNFQGTILAYQAEVTDWWLEKGYNAWDESGGDQYRGHLSGSLIAKSFKGGTEFGYRSFAGLASTAKYSVEVSKVDVKDEFVKGATLKLEKLVEDENGTITIDGKNYKRVAVEGYGEIVTSDKKELLEDLEPGYYILSETKAPKGYQGSDKEIYFEISEGNSVYTSIEKDTTFEKPYIYTVVGDGETPNEANFTISRNDADNSSKFIPVKPRSNPPKTYNWNWSKLYNFLVTIPTEIDNVTFHTSTGDIVTTNNGSGGVQRNANGSSWKISGSNNKEWNTIIDGFGSFSNLEYITIKIRLNTNDQNKKENITLIFMHGDPTTTQQTTLRNVTNSYKEYVIYGEGLPTEYYKIDQSSPVMRGENNDTPVAAVYMPHTSIVSSIKGKLTVYTDKTFSEVAKNGDNDAEYEGHPFDLEKNVYYIEGNNFVFKNTDLGYMMYKYDDQAGEAAAVNMADYKVEIKQTVGSQSGYVVFADGVEVDPMQILTKDMDSTFGFKFINKRHIYLSKTDINDTALNDAEFELKAASGTTVDWSKVSSVKYEGDKKILTPLGEGEAASVKLKLGDMEIEGLPDGTYTLKETKAPGGYVAFDGTITLVIEKGELKTVSVDPADSKMVYVNTTKNTITVKNNEEVTVEGTKTWELNGFTVAKSEITVQLYADGKAVEGKTATLSETAGWTYKFENLPKYKFEGTTVKEIVYTVKEVKVPDGFTASYPDTVKSKDGKTITADIINTYDKTQGTTSVKVTKVWDYDKAEFPKLELPEITVQLYADGKALNGKTVVLNAGNKWTATFTELPVYNADGSVIKYTVDETSTPAGFEKVGVTGDAKTGFTITNKSTLEQKDISISGKKTWVDNGFPGLRPASITVKLLANGKDTGKTATMSEGNWTYSFTKLDKYDDAGKEIKYTIEEIKVANYDTEITETDNGFDIKNTCTFKQEYIQVSGEKTWKGDGEFLDLRPDSITVYIKNGTTVVDTIKVTPDKDGNWKYTSKDLPKFDENGKEITYTVDEAGVKNYTKTINGKNIVNTLDVGQEYIDISGQKTWVDDGNYFNSRPSEITIKLLADGKVVGETTANAASEWKYEFTDLPVYNSNHEEIEYTVEEVAVDGYTTVITGYDIENTYETTQKYTSISGEKTWVGDNDHLADRPDSITVILYADGKEVDRATASKGSNWKYEFKDLKVYNADKTEIEYTIGEVEVKGYKSVVNGYDITNTYVEDKKDDEKVKTKVGIKKVDENSEALAGAILQILDENKNPIKDLEWTSGNDVYMIEGILEAGKTYYIHEVSAPEGYKLGEDVMIVIPENGVETFEFVNVKEDEKTDDKEDTKKTSVTINKVDIANSEEVEGAKLEVFDKDGNKVAEWTSKKDETFTIGDLIVGEEYTVKETVVPDGYEAISTEIVFTVDEDGKVTVIKGVDDATVDEDGVLLINDTKKKTDNSTGSTTDSNNSNVSSGDGGNGQGTSSDGDGNNQQTGSTTDDNAPQTGEETNGMLPMSLIAMALAMIALKKKRA